MIEQLLKRRWVKCLAYLPVCIATSTFAYASFIRPSDDSLRRRLAEFELEAGTLRARIGNLDVIDETAKGGVAALMLISRDPAPAANTRRDIEEELGALGWSKSRQGDVFCKSGAVARVKELRLTRSANEAISITMTFQGDSGYACPNEFFSRMRYRLG